MLRLALNLRKDWLRQLVVVVFILHLWYKISKNSEKPWLKLRGNVHEHKD